MVAVEIPLAQMGVIGLAQKCNSMHHVVQFYSVNLIQ